MGWAWGGGEEGERSGVEPARGKAVSKEEDDFIFFGYKYKIFTKGKKVCGGGGL